MFVDSLLSWKKRQVLKKTGLLLLSSLGVFGYLTLKKWRGVKAQKEHQTELTRGLRQFSYRALRSYKRGFTRVESLDEERLRMCIKNQKKGLSLYWSHRLNISIILASTLSYLHHKCEQQVEPCTVHNEYFKMHLPQASRFFVQFKSPITSKMNYVILASMCFLYVNMSQLLSFDVLSLLLLFLK